MILINLTQIYTMTKSEFEIFLSAKGYDTKTAGNCRNDYIAKKRSFHIMKYIESKL